MSGKEEERDVEWQVTGDLESLFDSTRLKA